MYRVVIWGNREQYDLYVNKLKHEELKGSIKVEGIVSDDTYISKFDDWKIIEKSEIMDLNIDCVFVTSVDFYYEVTKQEILSLNPNVQVLRANILNIPLFDMERYMSLLNNKVSIIAHSCWAGLTYNSLYLPFDSPFINLSISAEDYIKLLSDFNYYISLPLTKVRDRGVEGNPIGALGDVHIDFVHYSNFETAKNIWNKRVSRINYDNLFVYMVLSNEEMAHQFSKLSIEKKYGFTSFPCDFQDVYEVKAFKESMEVKRVMGERRFSSYMNDQARRKLYDYDDELGNRGAKTVKVYDALKLLNGEKDFFRW